MLGRVPAVLWAQAMIALIICNQTAINLFSGSLLSNFFAMLIFQEKGHIRVFIIAFFFSFSSMFRGHYWCKLNCPRCDSIRLNNGNGSCLISRWDYVSTEETVMCPLDSMYGGRKVDRRPTGFEECMQNRLGGACQPSIHPCPSPGWEHPRHLISGRNGNWQRLGSSSLKTWRKEAPAS